MTLLKGLVGEPRKGVRLGGVAQQKDNLFLLFDQLKNWKFYFPHNNMSYMLSQSPDKTKLVGQIPIYRPSFSINKQMRAFGSQNHGSSGNKQQNYESLLQQQKLKFGENDAKAAGEKQSEDTSQPAGSNEPVPEVMIEKISQRNSMLNRQSVVRTFQRHGSQSNQGTSYKSMKSYRDDHSVIPNGL